MHRYRSELGDELDRMARAEDAGALLADLKITHCPACDQPVNNTAADLEQCFLCHQVIRDEPLGAELGAIRLRFESDRLAGEFKEADELVSILQGDAKHVADDIAAAEERLRMLENETRPYSACGSGTGPRGGQCHRHGAGRVE